MKNFPPISVITLCICAYFDEFSSHFYHNAPYVDTLSGSFSLISVITLCTYGYFDEFSSHFCHNTLYIWIL